MNLDIYDSILTPCFILNKKDLENNIKDINQGREKFKKSIIGYSVKTNSIKWLLEYLTKNTDFYLEVVSSDEYIYALHTGISPQRIIFNGPCKTQEVLLYALNNGSIVNLDGFRDIDMIKNIDFHVKVGLRVNVTYGNSELNVDKFGYEESRFGFSYSNEFEKAISILSKNSNIKINGLHFHLNNKKREISSYIAISKLITTIVQKYDLKLEYIDVGGGYKGGINSKFLEYTSAIYDNIIIPNKDEITYIFEPGAALIATPISYLTRVIDVRKINSKRYLIVDGGRMHIDPTISNKKYIFDILSKNSFEIESRQIVTGFSCMENDRLLELVNQARLNVSDLILFKNLGAYTMTFATSFIKGYPIVYLFDNNNFSVIRDEMTIDEILGGKENGRVYRKDNKICKRK